MKTVLLVLLIVVILAAGWYVWTNYGDQLSQVPGQISASIGKMLTGMTGSLAGFGNAVRDSFRMPDR